MFHYDHIKYRNMVMQVVLFIITLGIYGIYWYYVSLKEMHIANRRAEVGSGKWTLLLLIPVAYLFALWHYAQEYAKFSGDRYLGIVIFILELLLDPVVWFLVQRDLNRSARYH